VHFTKMTTLGLENCK